MNHPVKKNVRLSSINNIINHYLYKKEQITRTSMENKSWEEKKGQRKKKFYFQMSFFRESIHF